MNYIVRKAILDKDGALDFDLDGIVGRIRLWVNGRGTRWFILVGNFSTVGEKTIKSYHVTSVNYRMDKVFQRAKVIMSQYEKGGRGFNMDIQVPLALLNAYTG